MAQSEPTLPDQPRPWYYNNWFLIATFILGWPVAPPFGVLWPVWGLLIIRSPWHNHTLLRGLGWAMLVVGAVIFVKALTNPQDTLGLVIATLIPGLLVTLVTQVMWAKYRLEHGLGEAPPATPVNPSPDPPSPSQNTRARRRANRRRSSRSGREPPY